MARRTTRKRRANRRKKRRSRGGRATPTIGKGVNQVVRLVGRVPALGRYAKPAAETLRDVAAVLLYDVGRLANREISLGKRALTRKKGRGVRGRVGRKRRKHHKRFKKRRR